jgi:hypothetical protein
MIRQFSEILRGVAVAALLLLSPAVAGAARITLQPSPSTVEEGDFVDVAVLASGLGIGAYDLEVTFDDTRLRFKEIAFGPTLGSFNFLQFGAEIALGIVNIAESSFLDSAELLSRQQGAFTLATLRFETVQAGTALLGFGPLGGVRTVIDTDFMAVTPDLLGGRVEISGPGTPPPPDEVPEPATMVTVGLSLLAVVATRRLR